MKEAVILLILQSVNQPNCITDN